MPDNFFRTLLYCLAAVALTAAGIIAVKHVATGDTDPGVHAAPAEVVAISRQDSVGGGSAASDLARQNSRLSEPGQRPVAKTREQPVQVRSPKGSASFAAGSVPAAAGRVVNGASVSESVIQVGNSAVELTVPVHPQSGMHARVPVALALAADPAGMPPEVQEAARQMAMDFLENVADVAAVADGARDAAYFERWQNAADLSDRTFKMRYGRIAYVQMNQAVAQEATAGVR